VKEKWGCVINLKEYSGRKFSGIIIVPKNNVKSFIIIYIIDFNQDPSKQKTRSPGLRKART